MKLSRKALLLRKRKLFGAVPEGSTRILHTLGVSDFHIVESWSTPGVKEFLRPQLMLHFKTFLQEAKVLERKK